MEFKQMMKWLMKSTQKIYNNRRERRILCKPYAEKKKQNESIYNEYHRYYDAVNELINKIKEIRKKYHECK